MNEKTEMGDVNNVLSTLQSDVSTLKAKVEEHDDRIDQHDGRLDAIEQVSAGMRRDLAHVIAKVDRIDTNMTLLVRLVAIVTVAVVVGGAVSVVGFVLRLLFGV